MAVKERKQDRLAKFQIFTTLFETEHDKVSSDDSATDRIPVGWPYMSKTDIFSAVTGSPSFEAFGNECTSKAFVAKATTMRIPPPRSWTRPYRPQPLERLPEGGRT